MPMLLTTAQHRIVAAMFEAKARTAPAADRAELRRLAQCHRGLASMQDARPELRPVEEVSIETCFDTLWSNGQQKAESG
jgi:hypothetical protein